ncbi:MAG TPA: hypothetical protein VI457_03905 [Methylococcaceae bacterium]|nr:hypothetical protein [Methylococcaceae bacterium]
MADAIVVFDAVAGIGAWEATRGEPLAKAFPAVADFLSFGDGEPAIVEAVDGDAVQVFVLGMVALR